MAVLILSLAVLLSALAPGQSMQAAEAAAPQAVATFESIGLRWRPAGASANKVVTVEYRSLGSSTWKEGFPLWFSQRTDGPEDMLAEYRGSLVHLQSGTTYEIRLSLQGTSTTAILTASTWSESFPIAKVVNLPATSEATLEINQSGTANGYVVYTHAEGKSTTIDGKNQIDNCINIDAAYIIIRDLTIKNCRTNAIFLGFNAHDIVIEDNDISGWGRSDGAWAKNLDAAVRTAHGEGVKNIQRIIVQRNLIHDPTYDTNSWDEERPDYKNATGYHPAGAQAVTWFNTGGNHVIRFNHVYSNNGNYFNDGFGGGYNYSFDGGFPGRDSDIYGNLVQNCWDDGIESEGDNLNVRIWANYVENCYQAVATRSTVLGPIYIWRNVFGASRRAPMGSWDNDPRGHFHKVGSVKNGEQEWGDWGVFVFHNTIFQPQGDPGLAYPIGAGGGMQGRMINTTTRNNILHVYKPEARSIHNTEYVSGEINDFDYDLYNGVLSRTSGHEQNGIQGVPAYSDGAGFDAATSTGVFTLRSSSLGYDAGVRIPNINDDFQGAAPDIGAHEAGTPPMVFGPAAAGPVPASTFADVPATHPYHAEIEALFAAGYTAGCGENPLRYCPEQTMNRAESAVFVVRGVHGVGSDPSDPASSPFGDLGLSEWALKWATQLYADGYTAGCGTDPLRYCPWQGHTRAEGAVFYLRMLHGADYEPPAPQGIFSDVAAGTWYARWVEAAYAEGLLPACGQNPLRACPEAPLDRGLAAYMLSRAKGLLP